MIIKKLIKEMIEAEINARNDHYSQFIRDLFDMKSKETRVFDMTSDKAHQLIPWIRSTAGWHFDVQSEKLSNEMTRVTITSDNLGGNR